MKTHIEQAGGKCQSLAGHMQLLSAIAICLLAVSLMMMHREVLAQNASTSAKPSTDKAAQKPRPAKRSRPAAKAPEPPLVLPAAEGEQMAAAAMTHFGHYECEFSQEIHVDINRANDGYIDVRFGKQNWIMKPVLSSTGALRLEDVRGGMLMLQIANKSMLMDTRKGQRVADDCVHENQRESNRANKAAAAASPNGQTGELLR